jgi:hypothetical protein
MKNTTNSPAEYICIIVESTRNIQAWIPVLIEMIKKNCGVIEVYSPINFNDDYTDLLIGTIDQSYYNIQISIAVQEFNEYLGFFAERTRQGDIISIWESVSELEDLLDEITETNAATNDTARKPEKEIEEPIIEEEISNKIKSSTPEELAAELISFAKKEFPDQEDERRVPIHIITGDFWRSKNIERWYLPADIKLKIKKAELLAQKQLEGEREVKEKEKMLSLVNPCVDWAKEHGLKKVTEADVIAFLLEREIDLSPRTKKRSLQALVNNIIKSK